MAGKAGSKASSSLPRTRGQPRCPWEEAEGGDQVNKGRHTEPPWEERGRTCVRKPQASPLFSPNTVDPEGLCLQGGECSRQSGQATGVW